MNFFTLHPDVYSTDDKNKLTSLPDLLDYMWNGEEIEDKDTLIFISGFSNYNGGVRFYDLFEDHINKGGKVLAYLSASANQRLSSQQVVKELISRGVAVTLINRKRLVHSKLYGFYSPEDDKDQGLVISSGNFTGPGMNLNVESSLLLDSSTLLNMNFSWKKVKSQIEKQNWQFYPIKGSYDTKAPYNKLLYDELKSSGRSKRDESENEYLITTLSQNDTSRIVGRVAGGTQYIWLSKNIVGYFPPLLIRNKRGRKKTYSSEFKLSYPQLKISGKKGRVTFEAENNMDFRFLTTNVVYRTKIAYPEDLAVIKKVADKQYEVVFISSKTKEYTQLNSYATRYIGNKGKRYGFINKETYKAIVNNHENNLSSMKIDK